METYQVVPLLVEVDQRVMPIKGYWTLLIFPELKPYHHMQISGILRMPHFEVGVGLNPLDVWGKIYHKRLNAIILERSIDQSIDKRII